MLAGLSASELVTIISAVTALLIVPAGSVWALAWMLSGKFTKMYDRMDHMENAILIKLEYHERHDDTRFKAIHDDVWDIRVRNAARDGLAPLAVKDKP